jgi:glutamyl-tRNA synthetase
VEPFEAATLEQQLHDFVEQEQIKIGDIIHALRVAVTGKSVGFGMFETLAILGRERCLSRIGRALSALETTGA